MKNLFSFLLLFFAIASFAQDKNVKITIKALGSTNDKVIITSSNLFFDNDTLANTTLNTEGNAVVGIQLSQPIFVGITIGNKGAMGYLIPNDNVGLSIDLRDEKSIYTFTGKGAEANNYLAKSGAIFSEYFRFNGKQINEWEPEIFASRLAAMEKAFADFHQDYISKNKLPQNVGKLLEVSTHMAPLAFKNNYIRAHFRTPEEKAKMPELLKRVYNEIPFIDELLAAKYNEYTYVLKDHFYDLMSSFFEGKTPEENKAIYLQFPKYVEQTIKKGNYSPTIKEFLLALNVYEAFGEGINKISTSVYNNFINSYPSSFYLSSLDRKYQKWLTLSKGTPAPDFVGLTPDGKKVALSDLKGKIVYVDIWATWCAPCRAELPKSKEIHKQFSTNENVAFLYVSIDNETDKWKKFLKADPNFKGLHINISNQEQVGKLYKTYQMAGVPTYLLIDQEGKIASAPASRPSSGKVEDEIRGLLK
jgi:thiol-disulfide isomerase/thioredoxin/archaellum component FlaF (FlaF/FlaG flagellin family)